jgi:FlaA1/EpsC-like NDP-sugar epimerase
MNNEVVPKQVPPIEYSGLEAVKANRLVVENVICSALNYQIETYV